MRIERSTWGLLMAGVLALACGCSGRAGGPIRVEEREWRSPAGVGGVQLLTDHYDIRTTSQDTVLREYLPEFMEGSYREYVKLIPPEETSPERMVVYVFGRRTEWALFTQQFVPPQAAHTYMHILSGGYMDQATATAVTWDIKRDYTLALLAHEGLHQYLARHRPGFIPPWLNEGLAAQYEDFELDGARPIFRPERNLMRKNSLREAISLPDGFVPMERFLAMNAGDAVTRTGQLARGYYAQVWATVLFLRTSPQYRVGFQRLLEDMGTQRLRTNVMGYRAATPSAAGMSDGEVVFRHYITENVTDFGDAFNAYARELVY